MTDQLTTSVLRKMLTQDGPTAAEVPLTVTRALRLSAARAAEKSVGLLLTVQSVSEELLKLDELLVRVSNDQLLLQLHQDGAVGIAALDTGLLAAVVESQTMGKLSASQPMERAMTAVDALLAEPFVIGLLKEMTETICGTDLQGWTDDVTLKGQYIDLRQIGLTLPQSTYRLLQISIDLTGTERSGNFYLALPVPQLDVAKPASKAKAPNWSAEFPETIGLSPASLPVILHRFDISLSTLDKLEVGQTLQLSRSRVDSARLEMPDEL